MGHRAMGNGGWGNVEWGNGVGGKWKVYPIRGLQLFSFLTDVIPMYLSKEESIYFDMKSVDYTWYMANACSLLWEYENIKIQ